ncbi:MAG: HAMP domain-containing protein [Acidobacteria bacterium]|nr:HAMP domain-containing protein [Acidobacteriota bacterium]
MRARLTLWYAGVLALVLILFASGVYVVVQRETYARLDAGLASSLQVIAASLQHEIEEHKGQDPGEDAFRGILATMHRNSFPRKAIGVYQGARAVGVKPSDGGLSPADTVVAGTTPRFVTIGSSRTAAVEVRLAGAAAPYRVVAAESLNDTLAELRSLEGTLLLAVPLAVALAGAVGYLLARKSLAPVVAMSNDVDRIGSANLAARVEVPHPRDELGKLAGTFNRLLERLQLSFDRQKQFMADVSHELRTPISVARTAAQVNLAGPDRPAAEYREALDIIEKQMARLTRVVNDLFLLSKTDTGAAQLHRRRFALDETLRDTVKAARVLAAGKQIAVSCGEPVESPADGDEDLIRQLVLLLLDNAIQHTPSGGTVRVDLQRDGGYYRITVADTGCGIPIEAQPLIFDRFYRVDKARSRCASSLTGGAGLGLSIGRWIAQVHGGSLTLLRSTSEGSVFCVSLPAA